MVGNLTLASSKAIKLALPIVNICLMKESAKLGYVSKPKPPVAVYGWEVNSKVKGIEKQSTAYDNLCREETRMNVTMYTDGSARGNPNGPGGYGTVVSYIDSMGKEHVREFSAGYQKTTNNRMELMAAIVGLEALKKPCMVSLYSDSQYLVKAFNEHWIDSWEKKDWTRGKNEPVKNADLWKRLLNAMKMHQVNFHWVKGHAGHPGNERCDCLATKAADGTNLLEDKME